MKPPSGDRLDDALDMWHNDSWDCPGGKPRVSDEQLSHGLAVMADWFREEFAPNRRGERPKQKIPNRPKRSGAVTSSNVPKGIREDVLKRDDFRCQRCGTALRVDDYSLQHRDARGMGGSKLKHTMANLVALCGSATTKCHGHVESFRTESYREGWLVPDGYAPEEWRVRRFQTRWEQPGDLWVPAKPHPDQADENEAVA